MKEELYQYATESKNSLLIINIGTNSDGNLNINLPRDSIESKMLMDKMDFIVLMYEGNSETNPNRL